MKISITTKIAAIALVACAAIVPVIAQQQGGQGGSGRPPQGPGRSLGMIVRMKSVQTELQLTQEQIQKISQMRPPQGGTGGPGGQGGPGDEHDGPPPGGPGGGPGGPPPGQGGEPKDNPLAKILNQNQLDRLKQLGLQFEAPMSFLQPDVSKNLGLTDDQRQSIDQVVKSHMRPPQQGERPDWKSMQANKAAAFNDAYPLLSANQKQAWAQLVGKAFANWEEPQRP